MLNLYNFAQRLKTQHVVYMWNFGAARAADIGCIIGDFDQRWRRWGGDQVFGPGEEAPDTCGLDVLYF
jgi:hypothetical protein